MNPEVKIIKKFMFPSLNYTYWIKNGCGDELTNYCEVQIFYEITDDNNKVHLLQVTSTIRENKHLKAYIDMKRGNLIIINKLENINNVMTSVLKEQLKIALDYLKHRKHKVKMIAIELDEKEIENILVNKYGYKPINIEVKRTDSFMVFSSYKFFVKKLKETDVAYHEIMELTNKLSKK